MSKARVVVSDMSGEESSSAPYSTRREKSRKLAQKRRDTYKQIMDDLTSVLPFPKEAVSQLDYNSRLRLALCFFRLKTMVDSSGESTCGDVETSTDSGKQIVRKKLVSDEKPSMFQPGMLQDLMNEALDGFLMVTQVDGTIVFLSESIHKHMGLFQSEHIGVNMFELIHEEDHTEVRSKVSDAEIKSLSQKGSAKVTFFCRMKCSRYKVANVITKSPGYKLVYISGTIKRARDEPFIACVVRPVSPPSVLEIRLEGNMFVCRYGVDFTCTYFDGRLFSLLGYEKDDLIGKKPFDLFHHDDIEAIVKCRNKVFEKGESLSGYYRFFNAYGQRIWLQTRASLIIDSRTGKPVCVHCMFFVISKDQGEKDFQARLAIKNSEPSIKEENIHAHDPCPVIERSDGTVVNPLQNDGAQSSEVTPSTSGSPSSSSVEVESTPPTSSSDLSPGASELPSGSSPSRISSFGGGQSSGSRSSLQSESPVDSGTGNEISRSYTHHGSSSSINSRSPLSGDSVFTGGSPPHEPISSTGDQPQSVSPDHRVDSCLPDSTTSNHSIPYGDQPNGQNGATVLSHTSNSDLGYRSGSSGSLSLRDRLTSPASCGSSPMKRTDSNTSSNISDASVSCGAVHSSGLATSLPLHASSPAGCMTSMSGGPEMHSQSLFHGMNGNGVGSTGVSMSDAPPPNCHPQPVDRYGNDAYSYGSMCNQAVTSNAGFTIPMSTNTSQQFGGSAAGLNVSVVQMNVGLNGGPQQFLPQSSVRVPVNGATGMDLADSLPDWIPDPTTTSSGGVAHQGINGEPVLNFQTTAGPGFEFIPPSLVGNVDGEEVYNPPPIISSASNMFVDSSVSGQPSNFSASFQVPQRDSSVTYNGGHATSDLPQLTGEDLKILDAFDLDHMQGTGDQLGPFVYQQTPLNYNVTM